ncbi:MAG: uracil-DNA glycosylase [Alphaproteobacteria bacterium]|nr:uracil-DNA glycosylase [Alphaproteobacteria bacterium]
MLQWLGAMGEDLLLGEAPVDHLSAARRSRDLSPPPLTPPHKGEGEERLTSPSRGGRRAERAGWGEERQMLSSASLGGKEAGDARAIAARCQSLDALKAALEALEGISLKTTATNLVFADGNPEAPLMFIGEAPGREEDLRGLPFVGPSGQLLDRIIASIGRDRSSCYITNMIFWRPPGNREPTPQEMAACIPFVERHIALVRPEILVAVGNIAAKHLLGRSEGITRLRGKWGHYRRDGLDIPLIATFHPAGLLRNPLNKRYVWRDFLSIAEKLEALS